MSEPDVQRGSQAADPSLACLDRESSRLALDAEQRRYQGTPWAARACPLAGDKWTEEWKAQVTGEAEFAVRTVGFN
jgi:hypothetical protein